MLRNSRRRTPSETRAVERGAASASAPSVAAVVLIGTPARRSRVQCVRPFHSACDPSILVRPAMLRCGAARQLCCRLHRVVVVVLKL